MSDILNLSIIRLLRLLINIMAFVIPIASRKETKQTVIPGPGSYDVAGHQKQEETPAPFGSTCERKQVKKSKLKTEVIVPPGPGAYDPGMYEEKNKVIQSAFKSKSVRFGEKRVSTEPGPGSYNPQSLSPKKGKNQPKSKAKDNPVFNMIFNQNQNRKSQSIKQPSHYVRVVFKNPSNDNVYVSQYVDTAFIVNKQIGPGQYDPEPSFDKKSNGTQWSKSKSKRFQETRENSSTGPGSYNTKSSFHEYKPGAKAAFKSQNAKSCFDSAKFKSCHQPYIDLMNKLDIKDDTPGPGNYQIPSSFKQKECVVQSFGSESIRFAEPPGDCQAGPGSYDLNVIVERPQPLVSKLARRRRCKSEMHHRERQVRPHSYQASSNTIHQNLYKLFKNGYYGHFGSKVDRFKQNSLTTPGPGKYNPATKQKQVSITSYIANSKRVEQRKQESPFLTYNLNMYDIGKTLERKQDFLKNLELVEVKKPGFESSVQRFQNPSGNQSRDQQPYHMKQDEDYIKRVKERNQKISASFKSTTKRGSIEPWDNSTPPPGYYHRELRLQKLSYNMKYGFIEKVERERNRASK